MKYLLVIATFFLGIHSSAADTEDIIIRTAEGFSIESLGLTDTKVKPLIKTLNINLLKIDKSVLRGITADDIIAELSSHPQVIYAQKDHVLTLRRKPNDKQFAKQWSMEKTINNFGINAISAWSSFGTGGKDGSNNDVVVGVVDGGVDVTHPDLVDNIWVNKKEIPGNNIDDDHNGYIDDVNGWNAYRSNGTVEAHRHGSHVAGIIGARGDNNLGIAGVNWNVKIMAIGASSRKTSVVMEGYEYLLKQKKLWISSHGRSGANIVAANSSFGIDRADCTNGEYPAWDDMYNRLGKVGILSIVATANAGWDIDKVGDVPTSCSSPYIISVTNSDNKGARADSAWGKTTIDLAAPGENILSTVPGRFGQPAGVISISGTSMSTPHVAGAVAYLHSVASPAFNIECSVDPAKAALALKEMLLTSVAQTPQLKMETVAGGILDLFAASKLAANYKSMPIPFR